jgi:hypothetical protein
MVRSPLSVPAEALEMGGMPNIRNMIGAATIIVGTIAVGFSPERWDTVILVLPRGHGIHAHDLFGMALVAVGIALLWRSPRCPCERTLIRH